MGYLDRLLRRGDVTEIEFEYDPVDQGIWLTAVFADKYVFDDLRYFADTLADAVEGLSIDVELTLRAECDSLYEESVQLNARLEMLRKTLQA